jgi:peptidoglycan/LPS O-acetylase OafA/YrhL
VVSTLSYRFVERPALELANAPSRRSTPVEAAVG